LVRNPPSTELGDLTYLLDLLGLLNLMDLIEDLLDLLDLLGLPVPDRRVQEQQFV
jgi:hypothetical protein